MEWRDLWTRGADPIYAATITVPTSAVQHGFRLVMYNYCISRAVQYERMVCLSAQTGKLTLSNPFRK
jgi:hypothetical protein